MYQRALHKWLRHWGTRLKRGGYRVVNIGSPQALPEYVIHEESSGVELNEISAYFENEKAKIFFDPKHQRSKRLGKRPEE